MPYINPWYQKAARDAQSVQHPYETAVAADLKEQYASVSAPPIRPSASELEEEEAFVERLNALGQSMLIGSQLVPCIIVRGDGASRILFHEKHRFEKCYDGIDGEGEYVSAWVEVNGKVKMGYRLKNAADDAPWLSSFGEVEHLMLNLIKGKK
jgi:hypothetical protein